MITDLGVGVGYYLAIALVERPKELGRALRPDPAPPALGVWAGHILDLALGGLGELEELLGL